MALLFYGPRALLVRGVCVALAALTMSCKDNSVQTDTLIPPPAPSAPAGAGATTSVVDTRCLATGFGKLLTVSDDFPLCVVGAHAAVFSPVAPDTEPQSPLPFSAFGQPSWRMTPATANALTGGPLTGSAPPASETGVSTTLDKWTVDQPGNNRSTASRIFLHVRAGALPPTSAFTAALELPLAPTAFTLLAYAQAGGLREGELFLVNTAGFIRSSVNGVVGAAAPVVPTPERMFFYTGLSALYEGAPPAKASGLYRASCVFTEPPSCTSKAVASWSDTPGLVAADADGNLVAVHSGLGSGQEVLAFDAASLGGSVPGTRLKNDGNVTTSLTVTGRGGDRKLVLVETNNTGLPLPIQLRALSGDGGAAVLAEPGPGSINAIGRLQVFHDPSGDLWIAGDNPAAPPGERTPTFFHFSVKRTASP